MSFSQIINMYILLGHMMNHFLLSLLLPTSHTHPQDCTRQQQLTALCWAKTNITMRLVSRLQDHFVTHKKKLYTYFIFPGMLTRNARGRLLSVLYKKNVNECIACAALLPSEWSGMFHLLKGEAKLRWGTLCEALGGAQRQLAGPPATRRQAPAPAGAAKAQVGRGNSW